MNLKILATVMDIPKLSQFYWWLAILRIILVLVPQLGYIHPDEFFQSVEVQAGKVFDAQVNIPWEFNSTFPIRSVTIPYFSVGLVYRLGLFVNHFLGDYKIITPYFLVVGPRLLMCVLSFLIDFSVYKICATNNECYQNKLVILASSYVVIVYGTRTFSNTVELILFALLLYYVCESLIFSNILIKKRDYLNYRYDTSTSILERVKFHKLRLFLVSDSLRHCTKISTIVVFGFFNRPTFLAFALFPVFFWLYRGMGTKTVASMNFHLRILVLILCSIPSILFNVVMDSFFYGYLTWGEIGLFNISIDNFVFTPFNFFKYNINTNNLAKHGLHPRFLHLLVNMPLLFNVLAVSGFYGVSHAVYNLLRGKHTLLPTVRSIKGLMMLSYIAPLALLSIFPHQEPRFLIPLVVPLVYLYSPTIFPETDNILVKLDDASNEKNCKSQIVNRQSYVLLRLWLTVNVIFIVFFGFLHQGGVFQVANFLSKDMRRDYRRSEYNIMTSHIYSIPESLFLQKSFKTLYHRQNKDLSMSRRFFLYEEGSKDIPMLLNDIRIIVKYKEEKQSLKNNLNYKVFLVIPSSLDDKFQYFALNQNLKFTKITSFYPHISTEAFPDLADDIINFYADFKMTEFYTSIPHFFTKLGSLFGLNLYSITVRS